MPRVAGTILNKAGKRRKELFLDGPVGGYGGITRKKVRKALEASGDLDDFVVALSTRGGSVYDGLGIYNLVKSHPAQTTCYIVGECASAGTIISSAFDKVYMLKGSIFMIHEASVYAGGNKRDLRKTADMLEAHDKVILDIYKERTGMNMRALKKLFEEEKYLTPEQAKKLGFIDGVVDKADLLFNEEEKKESSYFDDFFFYSAKAQEEAHKFVTNNGIGEMPEPLILNILQDTDMNVIQAAADKLKKIGMSVKLFNSDGEEQAIDSLTAEQIAEAEMDLDKSVADAVAAQIAAIQPNIGSILIASLKSDPAQAEAIAKAFSEELDVKGTIDTAVAGLRKEINQIKGSKTGGQGAGGRGPIQDNSTDEDEGESGAANRGNASAVFDSLVAQGILTEADRSKYMKGFGSDKK